MPGDDLFEPGVWPTDPPLRFISYWALRREELCEPDLCPNEEASEDNRCPTCPIHQLNRCYNSDKGQRISAANETLVLLDAGLTVDWDSIPADLALAIAIVKGERQRRSIKEEPPQSTPA